MIYVYVLASPITNSCKNHPRKLRTSTRSILGKNARVWSPKVPKLAGCTWLGTTTFTDVHKGGSASKGGVTGSCVGANRGVCGQENCTVCPSPSCASVSGSSNDHCAQLIVQFVSFVHCLVNLNQNGCHDSTSTRSSLTSLALNTMRVRVEPNDTNQTFFPRKSCQCCGMFYASTVALWSSGGFLLCLHLLGFMSQAICLRSCWSIGNSQDTIRCQESNDTKPVPSAERCLAWAAAAAIRLEWRSSRLTFIISNLTHSL